MSQVKSKTTSVSSKIKEMTTVTIMPCLLCRESLPYVQAVHEEHLKMKHKVDFHIEWIIRKTLLESGLKEEFAEGRWKLSDNDKQSFIDDLRKETSSNEDQIIVKDIEKLPEEATPNINSPNSKPIKCEKIDESTTHLENYQRKLAEEKDNLKEHVRMTQKIEKQTKNVKEKNFKCDECSTKFVRYSKLILHQEEIHKGVRYPCDECNYKASRKYHLKTHVESAHKGIRYSCEECNYTAKGKQTLTRHVKAVHEGIRYPCDQCFYKAAQPVHLKTHIELIHNKK